MDVLSLIERYGIAGVAIALLVLHVTVSEHGDSDKAQDVLLGRLHDRVRALEARPAPQDTRFGQEMDRRVDRLEAVTYQRPYTPPPSEYVGP